MSGLYWCLAALDLADAVGKADTEFILEFVKRNQNKDGGFAAVCLTHLELVKKG
jgi:prenyltransferase beta subunit